MCWGHLLPPQVIVVVIRKKPIIVLSHKHLLGLQRLRQEEWLVEEELRQAGGLQREVSHWSKFQEALRDKTSLMPLSNLLLMLYLSKKLLSALNQRGLFRKLRQLGKLGRSRQGQKKAGE
jgi:hypothetical protein